MGLARTFKYVYELRKSRRLSLASIQQIQHRKLLRLLHHAKKCSPFYAHLYRDLEINDSLRLEDVPIVNKKTLMDNFDNVITVKDITKQKVLDFIKNETKRRKINGRYTPIHSGGTSGSLWISLLDENCFDYEIACIIEDPNLGLLSRFLKTPLRIAAATSGHPHVGSTIFYGNLPKSFANLRHFSVRKPLAEIVEELNSFAPDVLGGYPSILKALAEQKLKGTLTISPQKVFSGSFLLDKDSKQIITKAFNCVPYDDYYATEATGPIATECIQHRRHILLNSTIVEVLDSDNQPVACGKPGKIVITNLMNFVQPIIRYRLNDIVQTTAGRCLCGSSLPVIEKIWGRAGDIVWIKKPDGNYEVIDPILFNLKIVGLEKIQVIQEENDFLKVKIVVSGEEKEVVKQVVGALIGILKEKAIHRIVKVKTETVPDILTEPKSDKTLSGYHKLVISKVC